MRFPSSSKIGDNFRWQAALKFLKCAKASLTWPRANSVSPCRALASAQFCLCCLADFLHCRFKFLYWSESCLSLAARFFSTRFLVVSLIHSCLAYSRRNPSTSWPTSVCASLNVSHSPLLCVLYRKAQTTRLTTANRSCVSIVKKILARAGGMIDLVKIFSVVPFDHHAKVGSYFSFRLRAYMMSQNRSDAGPHFLWWGRGWPRRKTLSRPMSGLFIVISMAGKIFYVISVLAINWFSVEMNNNLYLYSY